MAKTAISSGQGQGGIALSTEFLPVWNFLATGIMLAASIMTLLVFTADVGRYVPTGSVMGFEGPSYFYITGFWGLIVSICWLFSMLGKLKRLSISARDDGALLVHECVIGGTHELAIPAADLKAVMLKRYPTAGHVTWFVIAIGWLAFILQFTIMNLQLPSVGFPVAGMALLVFGGFMAGTAVIGVVRPGFHLVIIDKTARHVIKLPGARSAETLASRIITSIEMKFKLQSHVLPRSDSGLKTNTRSYSMLLGAGGFLILGAVNVVLLLAGSASSFLNPVSAWVMVMAGCLAIVDYRNRGNALPLHTRVAFQDSMTLIGPHQKLRLWMMVIGIIGCVILWYFVGLTIHFDLTRLGDFSNNILALGIISSLFTSWCTFSGLEPSQSMLVNLGDANSAFIDMFSLVIVPSSKTHHYVKTNNPWTIFAIRIIFGIVSITSFIVGYCI